MYTPARLQHATRTHFAAHTQLDATLAPPAPAPAPISGASSSGSGFLANNIVQAAPKGAIALGASDPVRDYEEADKFQVCHGCESMCPEESTTRARTVCVRVRAVVRDGRRVSCLS